jgi:hypothetical protein
MVIDGFITLMVIGATGPAIESAFKLIDGPSTDTDASVAGEVNVRAPRVTVGVVAVIEVLIVGTVALSDPIMSAGRLALLTTDAIGAVLANAPNVRAGKTAETLRVATAATNERGCGIRVAAFRSGC